MQVAGSLSQDAAVCLSSLLIRVLQLSYIFTTQPQKVSNLGRRQQQPCQRLYLL